VANSFIETTADDFGLANYRWMFDADFLTRLHHSLFIAVGAVAVELIVAIPLVLLLNEPVYARGALRSLATLPWAIPTIAIATVFILLADPFYGLINQVGLALGALSEPTVLLGDPSRALWLVTLVHAWKGLPLVFIILLGALQALDRQYIDAARVDGAGRWAQFWHVIFPHWRPAIALAAVLSAVYNFALFDITFLLTGGGPAGATETLPLLLYNQDFVAANTGRAAATGVAIFSGGALALAVVLAIEARLSRKYR
jgi:multiple sugar transport system permease protein